MEPFVICLIEERSRVQRFVIFADCRVLMTIKMNRCEATSVDVSNTIRRQGEIYFSLHCNRTKSGSSSEPVHRRLVDFPDNRL